MFKIVLNLNYLVGVGGGKDEKAFYGGHCPTSF